jgi:HAE1 family hydrophobic/amphiphilic exporter-1/multidrug efflux pump
LICRQVKIYGDNTELTIRTVGRLTSEEQFRNLIIGKTAPHCAFKQYCHVELGAETYEQSWKYNV